MGAQREIASKSFSAASGTEHFISITPPAGGSFEQQLAEVQSLYRDALQSLGLAEESAVFRRVFVSDAMNQARLVRDSALVRGAPEDPVAVSLVQQPPLSGGKIALLAYHLAGGGAMLKRRLSPHHLLVLKNGQRHLWTTGLCAGEESDKASPAAQTRDIFGALVKTLTGVGGTLGEHCVRTWIYLKDVDVFYQGMVESRGAVFAQQGLTGDTHFIASTGIEGACAHRYDLVAMDAYSNLSLTPGQVAYLNDFERLCATKDYNVHFERGTRVGYADRAHLFISGTASIDKHGQVVHRGEVLCQLERAIDNVAALLGAGGAGLGDLMHLIVYLRDPTDVARIGAAVAERFPDLPISIVQGAVCRPEWLVEVEGIAIARDDAPALPPF